MIRNWWIEHDTDEYRCIYGNKMKTLPPYKGSCIERLLEAKLHEAIHLAREQIAVREVSNPEGRG